SHLSSFHHSPPTPCPSISRLLPLLSIIYFPSPLPSLPLTVPPFRSNLLPHLPFPPFSSPLLFSALRTLILLLLPLLLHSSPFHLLFHALLLSRFPLSFLSNIFMR